MKISMLEVILVLLLCFMIFTFFYKQAIHEFRINQVNASQKDAILELWKERVPLIVRGLPKNPLWTREDVLERSCYQSINIFTDYSFVDWIKSGSSSTICPWEYEQAQNIASLSGIGIWAKQHVEPLLSAWFLFPRYESWAGSVGLHKTYATWTCILPVEGDIRVTIFPETMETYLPATWRRSFPTEWTKSDTPFVGDIKYMDIVVRAGTCLFMPPHWFVSWISTEESTVMPMVFTISYHSPISLFAFHTRPFGPSKMIRDLNNKFDIKSKAIDGSS
jgi:hypothetical protein